MKLKTLRLKKISIMNDKWNQWNYFPWITALFTPDFPLRLFHLIYLKDRSSWSPASCWSTWHCCNKETTRRSRWPARSSGQWNLWTEQRREWTGDNFTMGAKCDSPVDWGQLHHGCQMWQWTGDNFTMDAKCDSGLKTTSPWVPNVTVDWGQLHHGCQMWQWTGDNFIMGAKCDSPVDWGQLHHGCQMWQSSGLGTTSPWVPNVTVK